jgi:hypothetical protein
MNNIAETQPVITSGTIISLMAAILVLLVSFGLPITVDQRNAIMGVVAIVAPLAVIWWPQRKTTALADPKVTVEDGTVVSLIRADTGRATPQAIKSGNVV